MGKTKKKSAPQGTAEAFARIEAHLASANPAGADQVAGLELTTVVTTILGALPAVRAHREAIVAALPGHPVELLDALEDRALGAWYANQLALHGADVDVTVLEADGQRLREDLLIAAEPLAHRDLIDRARLAEIRGAGGPLHVDLVALAEFYSAHWSKIVGKTPVEKKEVEQAAKLGADLALAVDIQAQLARLAELGDLDTLRSQALALLVEAYDATRRALAYVRWHEGDLEAIAPTLKKRVARAKKAPGEESPLPPSVIEN
ncbi:MAG: hypothetical protein IPJ34_31565 [Myxococcales bacterium]|nr:hypothetical protein [Myxococcales bacterium]